MENNHFIEIPTQRELDDLNRIFSIFADSTRIRIICAIQEHELTVTDICAALEMSQSAISHQLRILKDARIVKSRRDGRNILYALDDFHVSSIIKMGLMHVREEDCDE